MKQREEQPDPSAATPAAAPSDRTSAEPQAVSLVEVQRGSITESRHRGHIIAVDPDGRIFARLGEPELLLTYLRSSAKPHQAIPLVSTGAADRFHFTERELALACGSHSGEPIHEETARGMLDKIGLDETALRCGTHDPFSRDVTRLLRERRQRPRVLQNNCSGKHAGMLALALHTGAPTETYDQPENPVQKMIARTVEQFSDTPLEDIAVGVDGCGVPVFGVTVRAMALMYARLVATPAHFDESVRAATRRIVSAMMAYPEMVGGQSERFDTEIMRVARGRIVSKIGAEGVYTAGILPCPRWPRGLGLAFKVEDGEDRRARPTVVIESLRQLGLLDAEALRSLAPFATFPVKNNRGESVGIVKPAFTLELENSVYL